MKKIVLAISLLGFGVCSYGQGYVTVAGTMQEQTNTTSLSSGWSGGSLGTGTFGNIGNIASGQSYYLALLTTTASSPVINLFGSGSALNSTWLSTGPLGANTSFAGRMSIGSAYQVSNAAIANSQDWLLVAWTANLGADWATIASQLSSGVFSQAGYVGWSSIGVGASGPSNLPLTVQGPSGSIIPSGFSLLAVSPVPEPGTLALAALGGASLLLFRRRK